MSFTLIDEKTWQRKAHFHHYLTDVPCTYSATFKLDVTALREQNVPFFPTVLHCLSTVVNRHKEFRMSLNAEGLPGYYEYSASVFYRFFTKIPKLFRTYGQNTAKTAIHFTAPTKKNMERYQICHDMMARLDTPENTFPVSALPWASFEGFNLNLQKGYSYLLPIFYVGEILLRKTEKTMLPLAVQVHHAVCDGFHLCRFVNELQDLLNL